MFEDKYKAVNDKIKASVDLKEKIRNNARNAAASSITVNSADFKEIEPSQKGGKVKLFAVITGCAACAAVITAVAINFSSANRGENIVAPATSAPSQSTAATLPAVTPATEEEVTDESFEEGVQNNFEDYSVEYMGDTYNFSEIAWAVYGAGNMYPIQDTRSLDEIKNLNMWALKYQDGVSVDWSGTGNYYSIGNGKYERYSYSMLDFEVSVEYGNREKYGNFGSVHFRDDEGMEAYRIADNVDVDVAPVPLSTINGYEVKLAKGDGHCVMQFTDDSSQLCVRIVGINNKTDEEFMFIVHSFCYDVLDGYTMTSEAPVTDGVATVEYDGLTANIGSFNDNDFPVEDFPQESMKGIELLGSITGRDFSAFSKLESYTDDTSVWAGWTNEAEGYDRASMMIASGVGIAKSGAVYMTVRRDAPDDDTAFTEDVPYSEYGTFDFKIADDFPGAYKLVFEFKPENGTLYRMYSYSITAEEFLQYVKLFFDKVAMSEYIPSLPAEAGYFNWDAIKEERVGALKEFNFSLFAMNNDNFKTVEITELDSTVPTDINTCAVEMQEIFGEEYEVSTLKYNYFTMPDKDAGLYYSKTCESGGETLLEFNAYLWPSESLLNAVDKPNSTLDGKSFFSGWRNFAGDKHYGTNYVFAYYDETDGVLYTLEGKNCNQGDFINMCLSILGADSAAAE